MVCQKKKTGCKNRTDQKKSSGQILDTWTKGSTNRPSDTHDDSSIPPLTLLHRVQRDRNAVVSHQGGLTARQSLIRVVSHQGGLSSRWSLIRVVSHQGGLSSRWSLIRVVSHLGGLSSGWSLI